MVPIRLPRSRTVYGCFVLLLALSAFPASGAPKLEWMGPDTQVEESVDVAPVVSSFPVHFCLLTNGSTQYVSYYDADRNLAVASRTLGSSAWKYKVLPSRVGWDSHNYITMALDDRGYLHLAGNMHCSPLIYFRSNLPGDIDSIERVPSMTGENETQCTYPKFLSDARHGLTFHYRVGKSGNGDEIYNIYSSETKQWSPLLSHPLIDGQGKGSAYMNGPSAGPDGWYHLGWIWRETPDCSSSHSPSYARSRDLVHWETIDGQPLTLPITPDTPGTLIDPIPPKGGIINGALKIGFDREKKPIAAYFKFDSAGNTQVYVARFAEGRWVSKVVSDWNYRWNFSGGGSINFDIRLGEIKPLRDGTLGLPFEHAVYGIGIFVLNAETLSLIRTIPQCPEYPPNLQKPESDFPKMMVQWSEDLGETRFGQSRYVLRWETLPHNRDLPRTGPVPPPGMLRVYKLRQSDPVATLER